MSDDPRAHELRSYGRRRGRTASARQAALWQDLLPRVSMPSGDEALADIRHLFPPSAEDVWLEVGFGGGEHLLWQAERHPRVGMIGCEPFQDGVVKVLAAIADRGIANIRLHADDVRPLMRRLPASSIGRAFVLFPDPWPKKRHLKRRLVSEGTLRELARVLRPGAELRLATDIADYAEWMLLAVRREGSFRWTARAPSDWRARGEDWPATRYETKAIEAGRRCAYFRLVKA